MFAIKSSSNENYPINVLVIINNYFFINYTDLIFSYKIIQ